MFTKLNRVLLASGLAVASAALLSPAAFAAPTASLSNTVAASLGVDVTLTWTAVPTTPYVIPSSDSASLTNKDIGSVSATGNVAYQIQATSAKNGYLESALIGTFPGEKLAYTISLDTGLADKTPLTATPVTIFTSAGTTALSSKALTFSTTPTNTTAFHAAQFSDTLTLTVSAQQ